MKYADRAKRVRDNSFFPKSLEVCLIRFCCFVYFLDIRLIVLIVLLHKSIGQSIKTHLYDAICRERIRGAYSIYHCLSFVVLFVIILCFCFKK